MNFTSAERQSQIYDLRQNPEGVFVYQDVRPRHRPTATKALIGILVAVFGLQLLAPQLTPLLAVTPAALARGEWWRLLTGAFVHAGLLHLVANVWFGWVVGSRLERYIGAGRLLLISLVAALGSGLLVALGGSSAVGFSGVLFGWLAAGLAFHFTSRFPGLRLEGPQWRSYVQVLIANLLLSLLPGISLLGHLGGLVSGFAAAFLIGSLGGRRLGRA